MDLTKTAQNTVWRHIPLPKKRQPLQLVCKSVGLLAFSLFLTAWNTHAQVVIAYCKLGGGCKFYQTQYTYAQVDAILNYLGTFEKSKGIMVFFRNKQDQDVHYPDTKRTPKVLHEYFGGKGEPNIAKGGIAPFGNVIQPNDGNWQSVTETPVAKNCPSQMNNQLAGIASLKSGRKVFKKPFTPDELLPSGAIWLTVAPNIYKAIILSDVTPSIKSIYDVEVVSPVLIKGTLTVSFYIPDQPLCEIKTDFTFKNKD